MARPIEKTPVITGEDAQRFRINLLDSLMPTLSKTEIAHKKKEIEKQKVNYQKIVLASNGVFY
jgi:hypothetical protein